LSKAHIVPEGPSTQHPPLRASQIIALSIKRLSFEVVFRYFQEEVAKQSVPIPDQLIHNVLTYESPLFLYSIMKMG
jgi:hypothetical protein